MSHDDFMDRQEEEEEDGEEHGPSPHIPGKPVGKVGGHQPDNTYDSPADEPANPGEEEEEDETRTRQRRQYGEGKAYSEVSSIRPRTAALLYDKQVRKILRQTHRR